MIRFAFAFLAAHLLFAQSEAEAPFPPHKVIGNIYYIGTKDLASYLITTPGGHILVNSSLERTLPQLRQNTQKLGFKFSDIKIILGSHAHKDHMESDAQVKALTGAKVMVMAEDVPDLKTIVTNGKPHPVDGELKDREEVRLGGVTLTAVRTPGHTKGCTTWTMKVTEEGKSYDAAIVCDLGVDADTHLQNNFHYPTIAGDYAYAFKTLSTLPVDVFLGAHASFYRMEEKHAKLADRKKGDPNPFIDPTGYQQHVAAQRAAFQTELTVQRNRFLN